MSRAIVTTKGVTVINWGSGYVSSSGMSGRVIVDDIWNMRVDPYWFRVATTRKP